MDKESLSRLAELASRQFSLFSYAQATAAGVAPGALRNALERGQIVRDRREIYAFPGHEPSRWRALMAAALAAGPAAVISHASAAAIHGFHGVLEGSLPELTVPMTRRERLEGVWIHRARHLEHKDVYRRRGLRVTVPVRTLIDMAPRLTEQRLVRVLDEGAISRLWTPERVLARLEEMGPSGRSGVPRLRRLLAERLDERNPANRLEQRVARVLKDKVPPFELHYRLTLDGTDIEMDLAWPDFKVDGEVEGRWVRATSKSKFDRDKRRANLLSAHGWRLVYFTSDMDDATIISEAQRALR